jgi:hypothetical protein
MQCSYPFGRVDPDNLLFLSSVTLAFCVGILSGLLCSFGFRDADVPFVVVGSGAGVAAVTLDGFRDGLLQGRSVGPVRLFAGNDRIEVASDGSFAIDHPGFHINEVTIPIPAGMRFVASRRGKKYYSVTSAGGNRIAPENRVYFPNEASAEAAGFSP